MTKRRVTWADEVAVVVTETSQAPKIVSDVTAVVTEQSPEHASKRLITSGNPALAESSAEAVTEVPGAEVLADAGSLNSVPEVVVEEDSSATPLLASQPEPARAHQSRNWDPEAGCWQWYTSTTTFLKYEILPLYYALHDRRMPFLCKLFPSLALSYALSPLQLIPSFIPLLGLADDLFLVPLLLWVSIQFVPTRVMTDARLQAIEEPLWLSYNWFAALPIALIWLTLGEGVLFVLLTRVFGYPLLLQYRVEIMAGFALFGLLVFFMWAARRVSQERKWRQRLNASLLSHNMMPSGGSV